MKTEITIEIPNLRFSLPSSTFFMTSLSIHPNAENNAYMVYGHGKVIAICDDRETAVKIVSVLKGVLNIR